MWVILIIVILFFVIKKYLSENGQQTQTPEIKMEESKVAVLFAEVICTKFSQGGEFFQWMIMNSKERMVKLDFSTKGVLFTKIEVNRQRVKDTGTYDVEKTGLGFGASGYQDLQSRHVYDFQRFIISEIKEKCPNVSVDENNYVKLLEIAKKSW